MALEHELAIFEKELPRLLAEGLEGRFVLIKDTLNAESWETRESAVEAGFRLYGLTSFLVRQVLAVQPVCVVTRLSCPASRITSES